MFFNIFLIKESIFTQIKKESFNLNAYFFVKIKLRNFQKDCLKTVREG